MKDIVWKLFRETGNPAYYMLYKELSKDGRDDEGSGPQGDGLQGKR
ncbi:MAG: YqzL family protein [Clostridiales bacterium]|nr:YqzL family protein [Clostridiales bacterium]